MQGNYMDKYMMVGLIWSTSRDLLENFRFVSNSHDHHKTSKITILTGWQTQRKTSWISILSRAVELEGKRITLSERVVKIKIHYKMNKALFDCQIFFFSRAYYIIQRKD